jgi:hypothetical protein
MLIRIGFLPLLLAAGSAGQVLENGVMRIEMAPDATVRLLDKKTGASWSLNPPQVIFKDKRAITVRPRDIRRSGDTLTVRADPGLQFQLRLGNDLEYGFDPKPDIEEVWLLNRSLA